MTAPADLVAECRTFTRYLVGRDPTPYVVATYCRAHTASAVFAADRFERRLSRFARLHPAAAHIADAYARLLAPRGALRKKLILLVAILEISSPFAQAFESDPRGLLGTSAALAGALIVFVPAAIVGMLMFVPLRLLTR